MIDPQSLTGEEVRKIREEHKLSRKAFAELCGFSTPSRVMTIETKDSFRKDDREVVARVINEIQAAGPKLTGKDRVDALEQKLRANGKLIREDDEDDCGTLLSPFDDEDFYASLIVPDPDDETQTVIHPSQQEAITIIEKPRPPRPFASVPEYPEGWYPFGTHAELEHPPLMDFSTQTDETGTPLYERPHLKLISNSEVTTWQRCRRKWWLAWYRRFAYGQTDYAGARAIGNRVHRALEAWYVPDGQERTDPRDALERVIIEDWTLLNQESDHLTEDEMAALASKFNDAITLERIMVEGYMQWVEETGADVGLRIIESEMALHADLVIDVDGTKYPVRIIGKLDVQAYRESDGSRVFVDHKTSDSFAQKRKTLHMSPQMLHYLLLRFLNSGEGDARLDGALFNLIRKVKRSASAKPPFYDRVPVHYNVHQIENYKRRLIGATRDIIRTEIALREGGDPMDLCYPTVIEERCSWDCDFFKICTMFDDGSHAEDALAGMYRMVDPLERYEGKGVLE